MFETQADFKTRKHKAKLLADKLRQERDGKLKSVRKNVKGALTAQEKLLKKQRKNLVDRTFHIGAADLTFRLLKYNPLQENFSINITIKSLGKRSYLGTVPITKTRAKVFWENPDLLIPKMHLALNTTGTVIPGKILFQGPDGHKYPAKNIAEGWYEPVTGMIFVKVPGGCFQMGSKREDGDEEPVHKVCVDDFLLGQYEVTQGEWQGVMDYNPSRSIQGNNYPVEKVSWIDITKIHQKTQQPEEW